MWFFSWKKIKYLGHIIDKDGRRPDPKWAAAIKDMPAPNNIALLQSFLGLANYHQVLIQNMHDMRASLNELLKKDKPWDWTVKCQEALEKIKEMLTSDLFLTHYNLDLEIIVASDASSYGVGACILRKMTDGTLKPIVRTSRTLLPAEKNYLHRKRGLWDYIQSQSSITIFMVNTSLYRPQATTHHFWLKKVFLPILPTDCRDGVQSY